MIVIAELKAPFTEIERADFVVKYNHNLGLQIDEDENSIRALDYDKSEKEEKQNLAKEIIDQKSNEQALADLKDQMMTAILLDDEEWKNELKQEYLRLIGE